MNTVSEHESTPEILNLSVRVWFAAKCVIPCKNGGRCIGNNLCRCPNGLRGDHCEIGRKQRSTCKCSHGGICLGNRGCKCQHGYEGRHCRRRKWPEGNFRKYPLDNCIFPMFPLSFYCRHTIASRALSSLLSLHWTAPSDTHVHVTCKIHKTHKIKHKQQPQ